MKKEQIEKLAEFIVKHEDSNIETTAEAKSIMPVRYKFWLKKLAEFYETR